MILDRYLMGEIIRPLLLGLTLLVLIYTGYSVALLLGEAASGQIAATTIGRLTLLNTITVLEVLLPSALYLSVVAAISRLHRDSEMAALRSGGVGEARIMGGVLKLALLVAVFVALISIFARPWAYRESYRLEAQSTAAYQMETMEPGQFIPLQGGRYMMFAREVDAPRRELGQVFVQNDRANSSRVIIAESARLPDLKSEEPVIEFRHGHAYQLDKTGQQDLTLHFGQLKVHLDLKRAGAAYRRKAEPTDRLARSTRRKDIAEYQWRLSTPVGTVLLALLAVPIARNRPRHGRSGSFFLAIVVYVAIFNLVSLMRTWLEDGRIPANPGLWAAWLLPAAALVLILAWPRLRRRPRAIA